MNQAWLASFYDSQCAAVAKARLLNAWIPDTHLVTSLWRPLAVMGDINPASWSTLVKSTPASCPATPVTPQLDYPEASSATFAVGRRASMSTDAPESPAVPSTPRSSALYKFPVTPSRSNQADQPYAVPSSPHTLSEIQQERLRLDELEKLLLATPRQGQSFEPFVRSKPSETEAPPPAKSSTMATAINAKVESRESLDWRSNRPVAFGGKPLTPEQVRYKNNLYRENVPETNRLSLAHLRKGTDGRTTVMIKDIPVGRRDRPVSCCKAKS